LSSAVVVFCGRDESSFHLPATEMRAAIDVQDVTRDRRGVIAVRQRLIWLVQPFGGQAVDDWQAGALLRGIAGKGQRVELGRGRGNSGIAFRFLVCVSRRTSYPNTPLLDKPAVAPRVVTLTRKSKIGRCIRLSRALLRAERFFSAIDSVSETGVYSFFIRQPYAPSPGGRCRQGGGVALSPEVPWIGIGRTTHSW
jgi:hypothetical protein